MKIHPHPLSVLSRKGPRHGEPLAEDATFEDVKDTFLSVHQQLLLWEESGSVQAMIHAEREIDRMIERARTLKARCRVVRRLRGSGEENAH